MNEKISRLLNELGYHHCSNFAEHYPEKVYSFSLTFSYVESVDKYLQVFETIKRYFPLAKIQNNIHNLGVIFKDE